MSLFPWKNRYILPLLSTKIPGCPDSLLFHSSDANLTLVRKVRDQAGQTIGAIVAHYPFSLLKQEIGKLQNISIYTELRQVLAGPTVTLFSHGNPEVKSGIAQKFVRIPNSKWLIAVWTPGGVGVEQYSETELPWLYMTLAVIALVGGLAILIIYRVKHPAPKKPNLCPSPSRYRPVQTP